MAELEEKKGGITIDKDLGKPMYGPGSKPPKDPGPPPPGWKEPAKPAQPKKK